MLRNIILFILFFCLTSLILSAQTDSTETSEETPVVKNLPSDPPRKYALMFGRTLLLSNSSPDSVPLGSSSSGTYSLGASIKVFLVGSKLGLRIAPGISWKHLTYENTQAKTYPTVFDSSLQLEREKHILTSADLGLSIFYHISTDEDGDPLYFVEAGAYGGYLLGGNYRRRYTDNEGLRRRDKTLDIVSVSDEWQPLQYGLMARIGYKWLGIEAHYRLSDLLDEFTNTLFLPKDVAGFRNPTIPPIEVGLRIFF
ncbi:MAG: outer membrane beta-barrel protein [Bacteroidota bacterium]